MRVAHPARLFWAVAGVVLAADQFTKHLIRENRPLGDTSSLIPGLLDLTHVKNTGAAFGLFPGRQPIFIATSAVVLIVIAAYWRRARPREWPVVVAMALIASGAVGNLIDRALLGKVTDFLSFAFVDFPVFNIADMGIVGGVSILVVWLLFAPEPGETPERSSESSETLPETPEPSE